MGEMLSKIGNQKIIKKKHIIKKNISAGVVLL